MARPGPTTCRPINDAFRPPPRPAVAIPDDWDLSLHGSLPAAPQPTPQGHPAAILPEFEPPPARVAPPPVVAPAPPPVAATHDHAAAAPGDDALLAAFLRGTGLIDAEPSDPVRMMEVVGAALRATVAGIRQTLIARASIKGEFRIEQTMVRASGNNPLKFSAGDDDAMAALLGIGRRNAMAADQAVGEALRDMRLHELATVSAMQIAVRALLAQFDPARVEKGVGASTLDKMPGHRKVRCWDAFTAMHANVTQALSDDFDSVFGKAFARAYEQACAMPARETIAYDAPYLPRAGHTATRPVRTAAPTAAAGPDGRDRLRDRPESGFIRAPVACAIRLYSLNASAKFESADIFALTERESATLGADDAGSEEFVLRAGESRTIDRVPKAGVQFLGVTALFRDIDHATWRAVQPVAAHGPTRLSLTTSGLTVSLQPAAPDKK